MVPPSVSARAPRRLRWLAVGQVLLWGAIGLGAFLLLAKSVQNSSAFNRLQPAILIVDVAGVIALSVLLTRKLWRLVRDYRAHVPGSRLTARTVAIFGALVVAPLLIVYLSSLEFINVGIDSWFKVEVKQGLNDAVRLSRAALDLRMREYSVRTQALAERLGSAAGADVQAQLDAERRNSQAREVSLFGAHGRILGTSLENPLENLPSQPPPDLVRQVGQHRPYVSLEPLSGGRYLIRTAAALGAAAGAPDPRFVVAIYPVPAQLAALSEAVQGSYSQYGDLAAQREPLKYSFRLTLTLVLLLSMLAAIYGAIFSAQRLVRPVQDLIEGTRAVGKGDFATRLPLPSRDEMGFLVHSFNDMTKRLRRTREEATRSQQAVERERERLAIILARLSTGVLAIDRNMIVRTANAAAGAILGTDLSAATGRPLPELAANNERLGQFVAALAVRFAAAREEWREQLDLDSAAGRRTLMCACTPLPGEDADVGFVIVFDDITALLQAQRDAAWGEVARRLAHEIKNPLTPIQLSAERLRRRLLTGMSERDAEILERGTRTIVQQVETMQQMVNAFSEYARTPEMQITRFNLNQLVTEVAELYRAHERRTRIQLDLDARLGDIEADRGRVRQILNNLLTNALEALEGVGTPLLEISTRRESGEDAEYAVMTVCDNGPGFQRELLGRVFDPYVTSKPKGTGLGLAIVKKIIEEHGGRIDADNRPEGGARVRVVLPVKDSTRSATTGAHERRDQLRRESMSTPHILVVDDEADIRGLLKEILSEEGYEVDVAANAAQARASRARQIPDLVLLDIWMPDVDGITLLREWSASAADGCPVVMMSGHSTVETAVEATRLGAFDFVEKPLSLAKLLRTVERALDAGRRHRQSGRLLGAPLVVPVGKSRLMQQLRADLQQMAANPSPLLLIGEPGSGREACARYLHEHGPRAAAPFVALIASSLRDADAEARLFGRETGEEQRPPGILEEAASGTLFIHELGDLPPTVQRLLFGVFEAGQFTRLGGSEPVPFRARLLSSAQPGIEQRAGSDGLRRDLLAQLNVLIMRVPPLREYAEDVPELLRHQVDRMVDADGLSFRRFSVAAQNRLRNYPWPDNVRELRHLVHRLLLHGGPEEIRLEEIERELAVQTPPDEPLVKQDLLALPLREAREQFERAYLQQQLLLCNGKVGQLAKRVGMERTHLYRKLRSLGVDFRNISED